MANNANPFANPAKWVNFLLMAVVFTLSISCAPQPQTYKVGILAGLPFLTEISDGFKKGMADLGYVEGQNITYDLQVSDFDMAAYQAILQKFVADKVDLILVFPTEAALEAKTITQGTNIPVVFSFAVIEGMGLVDSISQPGENITGVRFPGPDLARKRFETMTRLLPEARNIILPYQEGYPIVQPQLEAVRPLAEAAGVSLIEMPAVNAADIAGKLDAFEKNGGQADALLMLPEPLTITVDAFIAMAKYADKCHIPIGGTIVPAENFNSIFGLELSPFETGKDAAPLAHKIFTGTAAGTIPVRSPEALLRINHQKLTQMGIKADEGLLRMADEIAQ